MTIMFDVITDPTDPGRPVQNVQSRISLVSPSNPFTLDGRSVLAVVTVSTQLDGRWDADLTPIDQFENPGAYYHIDEGVNVPWPTASYDFTAPDTGGPYWIREHLVDVPPVTGPPPDQIPGPPGPAGPPGPTGPAGSPGTGAPIPYRYVQPTPASVWPVVHNLGYDPAAHYVVDGSGTQSWPDRIYVSTSEFLLDWGSVLATGYCLTR